MLLFSTGIKSQFNIVPNPSFEFTIGCPNFSANWNMCSSWNNVNLTLGAGLWGSPDYFHACGTNQAAPPNTFAGWCSPQSGVAMMSLVLYNVGYPEYREYLATPLNCAMQPNNTYTVSFWLSNGTSNISPWSIKNIGICFSSGPLTQSGYLPINATPQCEISTNVVSTGWTQYTFTLNPSSTFNYLTIGAFRSDSENNVTLSWPNIGGAPSAYANYFLDNVEVFAPTSLSNTVSVSSSATSKVICLGQTISLHASGAQSYSWQNGSTSNSIVVSPIVSTTYTVSGFVYENCEETASTASISITVLNCSGNTETDNQSIDITLFPNPCSSELFLSGTFLENEGVSLQVYNSSGELAWRLSEVELIQALNNHLNVFKTENLMPGLYFFRFSGENFFKTVRVNKI